MLHLLLIDDSSDDRTLTIHRLQEEFPDLQVEEIIDASSFNATLSRGNFDIAITDYRLGWTDGLTVLHQIKSSYPNCPTIMFTDSGNEEIAVAAMKAGLDDYIIKSPKHYLRLPVVVRSVLSRKQAEAGQHRWMQVFARAEWGIAIASADGTTLETINPAFAKMHGYTVEELTGHASADIFACECRNNLNAAIQMTCLQGHYTYEARHIRKNGAIFPVLANMTAVKDATGNVLYHALNIQDISDRKQAEEQIKASLQEKEVLLKEIHHRVKNNMQLICSLLSLQSAFVEDPQALDLLQKAQERVSSMALVHEQLYESENLAQIDFANYIQDLTANLFSAYDVTSDAIARKININNVFLTIDTAIPCGLIINELISNALKYAFPRGRSGEINIEMHRHCNNQFTLSVSDNGIGLPQNLDLQATETLGLQIVTALTRQLSGTLAIETNNGTKFNITFTNYMRSHS